MAGEPVQADGRSAAEGRDLRSRSAFSPALQPIPRWRVSGSRLRGLRAAPLPLPGSLPVPPPRARDLPPAPLRVTPCVPFDFSEIPLYFVDLQDDLDDCK